MSKIGDTFDKVGKGLVPQEEVGSYVTLKTACTYLGVGAITMSRLIEGGHLTLKRNGQAGHGTRYRFNMAEVVALKAKVDNGTFDLQAFKTPGAKRGRKRGTYNKRTLGSARLWHAISTIKENLDEIAGDVRAIKEGQHTTAQTTPAPIPTSPPMRLGGGFDGY